MLSLFGNYIGYLSILRSLPLLGFLWGFPHSSAGKESAYNAVDPSSIPESGRSAGEGIGYPLQYFWASLVAQLVKNLPAVWETWAQSLSWEDSLEKEKATHSSILTWRIPRGLQRVRHDWATFTSLIQTFSHSDFFSNCRNKIRTQDAKGHLIRGFYLLPFLQRGNVLIYTNYYDLSFCPLVAHSKKFYDSRSFPLYLVSLNYIVPIVS